MWHWRLPWAWCSAPSSGSSYTPGRETVVNRDTLVLGCLLGTALLAVVSAAATRAVLWLVVFEACQR